MRQQTELESLQGHYSDLHKDVYGFRPRTDPDECWDSMPWLHRRIDELIDELAVVMAEEKVREQAAIVDVEQQLWDMQDKLGARDRETAVRWMMDAHQVDGDRDYLCYLLGVPYGYFNEKEQA